MKKEDIKSKSKDQVLFYLLKTAIKKEKKCE